MQPVTIDNGGQTTSWFDLVTWPLSLAEPEGPAGIDTSVAQIHSMIDDLVESGVPSTKIVLGGFSQGGTLSILCGLTYSKPLGGVVSISGWAAYREALPSKVSDANKQLPMLFSVGTADPVVSFALGSASGQILRQVLGDSVSVSHVQRGMHQPDQAEMGAAGQFIASRLSD